MTIGTKSVLFGAHQFLIHPWFVAAAWWRLYGFPWDPRLWVAFFVHDLGYVGKPNMDGPEGETHPELGAHIMCALFDCGRFARLCDACFGDGVGATGSWHGWNGFTFYHSRYLAKRDGTCFSKLCVADKLALSLTPAWLYLPMVRLTGEAREYMTRETRQSSKNWTPVADDVHRWYANCQAWCRAWALEHRDCRQDTWTPEVQR